MYVCVCVCVCVHLVYVSINSGKSDDDAFMLCSFWRFICSHLLS